MGTYTSTNGNLRLNFAKQQKCQLLNRLASVPKRELGIFDGIKALEYGGI